MLLKTTIKYMEGYLPTPKSKKEKFRTVDESVEVEIPEFSKNDLHPAFIVHKPDEPDETIYLCGNTLYRKMPVDGFTVRTNAATALEALTTILANKTIVSENMDRRDAMAQVFRYEEFYIIVDGVLYRQSGEPIYNIKGCSNYSLRKGFRPVEISYFTPGNMISPHDYSALDAETAIMAAKSTALAKYGETSYLWSQDFANIEVLLPEACKFPQAKKTFTYAQKTDLAIRENLVTRKPVCIVHKNERFRVVAADPYEPHRSTTILVTLDCGLRMRLPFSANGDRALNWSINRADNDVLQIEITWKFMDRAHLDL